MQNRLSTNETENEICICLKTKLYFRFLLPTSAKSTLINYILVLVLWRSVGKYVHHNLETA